MGNSALRYNEVHAGKALCDYLSHINVHEAPIGDYTQAYPSKDIPAYVVAGYLLCDGDDNGCSLLGDLSLSINTSSKFKNVFDKTAIQLLKQFLEASKTDDPDVLKTVDMIKQINKNKLVIVPFKLGTTFNTDVEFESKIVNKDLKLYGVRWYIDKTDFKLRCEWVLKSKIAFGGKAQKVDLEKYLDTYRLAIMNLQGKSKSSDMEIVKINRFAMFQPIEFVDEQTRLVVDGSYLYQVYNSNDILIVGEWVNGEMNTFTKLTTKAYKKFKSNYEIIKLHAKYMAPFNFVDSNTVSVTSKSNKSK